MGHEQRRGMDVARLAARRQAGLQGVQQPVREVQPGIPAEAGGHGCGHPGVGEQVARRVTVLAGAFTVGAENMLPGPGRGLARAIHHGQLPPVEIFPAGGHLLEGTPGAQPRFQGIQQHRAESRIGDVLGGDGADAGPGMGAAGAHRDAGGGDRHPKHAATGAPPDDGKGHAGSPSGITAVASISISHSGRARPLTMSPVETG